MDLSLTTTQSTTFCGAGYATGATTIAAGQTSAVGNLTVPSTIRERISDLSGLHCVNVRAGILKIAFDYFPEDQWIEILDCIVNDNLNKLVELSGTRDIDPQKQLFQELSELKKPHLKKLLQQQISTITPMRADLISNESDQLSILATRCYTLGHAFFMTRTERSAKSINKSLIANGLSSLIETLGFYTEEEEPLARRIMTPQIEANPAAKEFPKMLLIESSKIYYDKKVQLTNTVSHTPDKVRTVISKSQTEKDAMHLAGLASSSGLQKRLDLFSLHPFLRLFSPGSRRHILTLTIGFKEALVPTAQSKAMQWMQGIHQDALLSHAEKIKTFAQGLIDQFDAIRISIGLQYLPLYLVVSGAKKVDAYFSRFEGKSPEYIREFPTKLIPNFCKQFKLPCYPGEDLEPLNDASLSKQLTDGRNRLTTFNIRNEEVHGRSVTILSNGGSLLANAWKLCLEPSIAMLNQTQKDIAKALVRASTPVPSPVSPRVEALEPTLAEAPRTCNIEILKELSLSQSGGGTSLWHVFVAHQMLQNQMTPDSCPYDITEALTTLCLAFENLLSDKTHTMTTKLDGSTLPEDRIIVEELTRLEIYARDVVSRDVALNRAQALIRMAHNCSKPGSTAEDLELLIATYLSYTQTALATYHRLSSSNPDLVEETSLFFKIPLKLHEDSGLLISKEDEFVRMISTYKSADSLLGDAMQAINRLYFLLKKDTGPSQHSYQLNSSIHLMRIIMEKWLYSCIEDTSDLYDMRTLLSKFPAMDDSLRSWILSLSSHSVESRFDEHDSKGHLSGAAREVTRRVELSSVKVLMTDEWSKAMTYDFSLNEETLTAYLHNLFLVIAYTEEMLSRASKK